MKVLSVNVGRPRLVEYNGEPVATGIYKESIGARRVAVNQFNLAGDAQADLRVHGGWSKSVYVYPSEHYEFWRGELPEMDLPFGVFGENLTTGGLSETEVFIGDRLKIGTAEFAVTEPRMPCYKLGIRFGRKDIIRRFLDSRRSGFYLAVLKTGEIDAGDAVKVLSRDENKITVADIVNLYVGDKQNFDLMKRAVRIEILPDFWKEEFRRRIDAATKSAE